MAEPFKINVTMDDADFLDRLLVADPAFRRLMEERRKESDSGKVSSLEEVRQRLEETS